jgi:hypothetical protein
MQLAVIGVVLAAATPAAAAPGLALRVRSDPRALLERVSASPPAGPGLAPAGLRLTTSIGGPASSERIEGRLETRTSLVSPQIGCWRSLSRGFFLGLELGWAVASSTPARSDATDGRRGAGLTGLARPTTSLLHFGWR